jgi:molecular chaperone HtpG
MSVDAHKETLEFQTEVRQLLHLMIHSLYSNKEIFLRELISNGSDACDKLRFEALGDDALYEGDAGLHIRIDVDKTQRTLTVSDNGIGMSRDEVTENLGTIARSGTQQFLAALTGDQAKDANLIGQFGVGFYSAFIVADKVTVTTRRAGMGPEHGVRWTSQGEGSYTLETMELVQRGTTVTLHLKDGEDEFLEPFRVRSIVNRYSDHIALPIEMRPEDEKKKDEYEQVNNASALWARPKIDITESEYHEFYKHVAHDFEDPLSWTHNHVEGTQSYTSLLFIPKRAPFDLWNQEQRHGIKLYVRRVFIMDDAEHLMPHYLRFVRGVVDSDDLPLNVSREILQHNKLIDTIRSASVKKVLGLLEQLAKNDEEKYTLFWAEFGKVMKEGPAEDFGNRERIAKDDEAQTVSLDDYIGRMQPDQDTIYYITAESFTAAKHSPHLEVFRKKSIEVLLLSDRVDEWLMSHLTEFDGKSLSSVAKGVLDLGKLEDKEEQKAAQEAEEHLKDTLGKMKDVLGERVKEIRLSHRLTDSPSCIVLDEQDMAVHLQHMLKQAGHDIPETRPILEINPEHGLIRQLKKQVDEKRFSDWTQVLFDQAMLAEGGHLDDPAAFVSRLNALLLESGEQRSDSGNPA